MSENQEIQDPVAIINMLQARIAQLEKAYEDVQRRRIEEVPSYTTSAIKALRLRAILPIYVGDMDFNDVIQEVEKAPLLQDARAVIWDLAKSPLTPEVIAAVKKATNNGASLWF